MAARPMQQQGCYAQLPCPCFPPLQSRPVGKKSYPCMNQVRPPDLPGRSAIGEGRFCTWLMFWLLLQPWDPLKTGSGSLSPSSLLCAPCIQYVLWCLCTGGGLHQALCGVGVGGFSWSFQGSYFTFWLHFTMSKKTVSGEENHTIFVLLETKLNFLNYL